MSINITVKLSGKMLTWLSEKSRTTSEIVKHINCCSYFNDRGHHPIKYVEIQLVDRDVYCISNDDGTVLKEIPDGLNNNALAEWIGSEMIGAYDMFHEAFDYGDIYDV